MKDIITRLATRIAESTAPITNNNEIFEAASKDINAALKVLTVAELMAIIKEQSKPLYDLVREAIGKSLDNKAVKKEVEDTAKKAEDTPRKKPAIKKTTTTRRSTPSYSSGGCGGGWGYRSSGC